MIEIFTLGWFANQIGTMARSKGHRAGKYRLMALMWWCAGEFAGLFAGMSLVPLTSTVSILVIYLCALLGAFVGAAAAYGVVTSLKPRETTGSELTTAPI